MIDFLRPFRMKEHGERRKECRMRCPEDFLVEFRKGTVSSMKLGQGRDISPSGLRFATCAPVSKGDKIQLTLYFPKEYSNLRQMQASAVVKRVYQPGPQHRLRVACEFLTPGEEIPQTLSHYMEWVKSESLTARP